MKTIFNKVNKDFRNKSYKNPLAAFTMTHHLSPLDIRNFDCNLLHGVTANQLNDLLCSRVLGISFYRRQLHMGERHLSLITHQARITFKVISVELNII